MSGYNTTAKDNRTGQTKKTAYEYDLVGNRLKEDSHGKRKGRRDRLLRDYTGLITYTCKLDRQKQRGLIAQRVTRTVVVGAIALGVVTGTPGLAGGLVVMMY